MSRRFLSSYELSYENIRKHHHHAIIDKTLILIKK